MIRNELTLSTNSLSQPVDYSEWISQAEAARVRGTSRQAIAKLVKLNRLATLEVGGRRFVRRQDILSYEPLHAGRPKVKR